LIKKSFFKPFVLTLSLGVLSAPLWMGWAKTVFHVDVGVVVVSFTVRDSHGGYVSGLKPAQICVREDGVPQNIKNFMEATGSVPAEPGTETPENALIASSVFILFDTSNCMYEGFARAEDGIENFIRHLDRGQAVAVYSFSHNLTRLARLTNDHEEAIRGLRNAVAGDSTALLNSTLLTLRDAAEVPGRKVVVVFSNGPDDTSIVAPEDVARVAEEEGIPIFIIATRANDPVSQNAFTTLADTSGGRLFLAGPRPLQLEAFKAIGDDLKHTYTLTYRPEQNDNGGWRHIQVQVVGADEKEFKVTARTGYRSNRHTAD
jgi:Ca-activated chloride channel homolog